MVITAIKEGRFSFAPYTPTYIHKPKRRKQGTFYFFLKRKEEYMGTEARCWRDIKQDCLYTNQKGKKRTFFKEIHKGGEGELHKSCSL